jgi:hypothetical protein
MARETMIESITLLIDKCTASDYVSRSFSGIIPYLLGKCHMSEKAEYKKADARKESFHMT